MSRCPYYYVVETVSESGSSGGVSRDVSERFITRAFSRREAENKKTRRDYDYDTFYCLFRNRVIAYFSTMEEAEEYLEMLETNPEAMKNAGLYNGNLWEG